MSLPTKTMRDALLAAVHQRMGSDENIFFLTSDFGAPALDAIRADYADRFLNVGIAEQNLINVSAGLALEGYHAIGYAIAPFLTMRCFEQIRISLSLLSQIRPLSVTLIGVGAGCSYTVSGPTHQCFEDLSLIRLLPNLSLYSPADAKSAAAAGQLALTRGGPAYIRLDAQALPALYSDTDWTSGPGFYVHEPDAGKQQKTKSPRILIIATGYPVHTALKVKQTMAETGSGDITVLDLADFTGFDQDHLTRLLSSADAIITWEEGFKATGGLDSLIQSLLSKANLQRPFLALGFEGAYNFDLGSRIDLHEKAQIGPQTGLQQINQFIQNSLIKEIL